MKKTWPYLRLTLPGSLEEPVTAILFCWGCSGTASDPVDQTPVPGSTSCLTAWFPDNESRDEAVRRLTVFGNDLEPAARLLIETGIQQSEDWLASWREGQLPFPMGRRFLVVPGDDEPDQQRWRGRHVLRITPGLAFGTGHHETTRFCLEQLENLAGDGVEFLDVGTGSGILAVAAVMLGCRRVVGVDIDPEAVEVASANIALHGLSGRVELLVAETPEAAGPGPFSLVAANILGSTLAQLAPALSGPLLGAGGRLLLAGILAGEEEQHVLRTYRSHGLCLRAREIDGEWAGLLLEKPAG